MLKILSTSARRNTIWILTLVLCGALTLHAQSAGSSKAIGAVPQSGEQRTARHFESLRKSPPQLLAFLLEMPKGGDLHNHLSGAVYAESYIQWAADGGACVNTATMVLSLPPCAAGQVPASAALTNSVLYRQMIDAWSMRNWQLSGQSGHDHFFDTFGKFGVATYNQNGKMIADVTARAARGHVLYLELMLTPDGTTTGVKSSQIGEKVGWDGNFESTLNKLKTNGIDDAAAIGVKNLQDAESEKDRLLKCGTPQADAGCAVTIRYVAQVSRGSALGPVFAQMVTGFALANNPNSKVVALNLVQPEDGLQSMENFSHIRESVMTAQAERIGHGVDLMHEGHPDELLREMARRNVMVEICLSSNDGILGITGPQHPLAIYLKYGVPVALATDDEGVSRSEISREFLKATVDQGLGYLQLKTMARNSLQYAFIAGGSLWSDGRKFVAVPQCRQDLAMMKLGSSGCRQYVAGSEKAKLQWKLEEEFRAFEREW